MKRIILILISLISFVCSEAQIDKKKAFFMLSGVTSGTSPLIISDDITSTSVTLYWSDVEASNYKLYQDNVEVYSGTALSYNVASGITAGNDYDFKVVADGASSSILTVSIPLFYNVADFTLKTSTAVVATRQTALEPSSGGVDKAISYSTWFRLDQSIEHDITQYLFNVAAGSSIQMACYRVNGSNQTPANVERLRFGLFNGANYIEVQTTQKILQGRWYHVVVTYDGSEANTGIEIYINGVLETLTRLSGGTYAGALDDVANRFRFGNGVLAARSFVGNCRDVCIWNKELNQTEVTEHYNGGVPVVVSSLSYYADIISWWPMQTNDDSVQNANYNFVTDASVTFSNLRAINVNNTAINSLRAESGNTRYVAFGDSYYDTNDSKVKMYVRSGTSHTAGGRVQKLTYDPLDRSVVIVDPVISDGTYSMSGVSVGKIGSTVNVFSTRYQVAGDTFIDSRMYKSTDGLTGETFDSGEVFSPNYTRFEFYGTVVEGNGFKVVPYFGHNGAGTWAISVFKSSDNFATKTKIDVINGSDYYGEAWLAYSRSRWILLIRRNQAPFGIMMSYSDDDCATWSVPVLTNLGNTLGVCNSSIAVNTVGNLNIVTMQRGTNFIKLSKNNDIDYVIANPTSFNTSTTIGSTYGTDSYDPLGYPNLVHLGNEEYFFATSAEQSSSRSDMYVGHGKINVPR